MVNVVIALECFGVCLIFVALALLLNGDGAREQKLLIFIMCGSLIQNAGYLLELTAPTLEVAAAAVTVENLGSIFAPLCYSWFIYIYCYARPPKNLLYALTIINFLVLPAVFFNWNGVFYRDFQWLTAPDGFHYISISYGPLYSLSLITRIIFPYLLSISTLARAIRLRSDQQISRQYQTILVITTLPVILLILYVFKVITIFDLTPLTFGVSMALVVIVVWSRRNYDFRHLAAEKVLESLGDGVIALDDHDRLVSYNRAAARIFTGLPSHKLGENIRVVEDFREEMLNEGVPWSFSIHGQHYECHSKQITDDNGKRQGCVILILDMTDIKAYINEIKRVRRQAEAANTAKSEFLANMSHEIRTPMNAIIGMNDIIMEESDDPSICGYARDVQSAAKNLLAIINDILDLSKVESGKMELVYTDYHLKTVADEVVGMMDMAASKRGLLMKYDCDRSIPCCYNGDEGRIKQILINILNNAVKFTREGYVRISVSGRPGGREDEELLTFRVEDTGCGIRQEDLGKIFEDFRQVDAKRNRSVEGTGLGLAIVKHLVELMGGSIGVESVYGKGTTFTITIPQKIVDRRTIAEVPELQQTGLEQLEFFTAPGIRVLIVDDNAVNRKVARSFLKSYAFELDEAESGPQAIEMVRQTRYDLIFMDHMMPMMDGIEATGIIRKDCGENGSSPVIIALTANAMEGMRERFLENGFQDFIAKPLDRKALAQLLAQWVPENRRQAAAGSEQPGLLDPDAFRIEGIDMSAAARYYSGDEAGFAELLELYCMDGRRKIGLLPELAGTDLSGYQTEVHALKSASANIGAMKVSEMARAQENAAARGDTALIEQRLPLLLEAYGQLLEKIGQALDEREQTAPRQEKLPALPARELAAQVGAALAELEDFRSREAAEMVEQLLRHELPREVSDSLLEIQGQLKLYEDDNAEALLGKLLRSLEKQEEQA